MYNCEHSGCDKHYLKHDDLLAHEIEGHRSGLGFDHKLVACDNDPIKNPIPTDLLDQYQDLVRERFPKIGKATQASLLKD